MLVTDRIQYRQYFPGIAVALVASVLAMLIAPWVSPLSPLLITMLAGIAWRNLFPVPEQLMPGNAIVEKPILRFGIVLLGLQIAAGDIINLGLDTAAGYRRSSSDHFHGHDGSRPPVGSRSRAADAHRIRIFNLRCCGSCGRKVGDGCG